jgi:plastocyanin
MRILRYLMLAALIAVFSLALAGCGDDSQDNTTDDNPALSEAEDTAEQAGDEASGSGEAIALAAAPDGQLKYDKDSLEGKAGNISIKFTNDSTTPHNVTVEDSSDKELGASEDITQSEDTLDLADVKAGSYVYYCSIAGHEEAGMKGTLEVK